MFDEESFYNADILIESMDECLEHGRFLFKTVSEVLDIIAELGIIVRNLNLEETLFADEVVFSLKYQLEELSGQMGFHCGYLKEFSAKYGEATDNAMILLNYLTESLGTPGQVSEEFQTAYEKCSALECGKKLINTLKRDAKNPLKIALQEGPERFEVFRWESIIKGVLAQLMFIEAYVGGDAEELRKQVEEYMENWEKDFGGEEEDEEEERKRKEEEEKKQRDEEEKKKREEEEERRRQEEEEKRRKEEEEKKRREEEEERKKREEEERRKREEEEERKSKEEEERRRREEEERQRREEEERKRKEEEERRRQEEEERKKREEEERRRQEEEERKKPFPISSLLEIIQSIQDNNTQKTCDEKALLIQHAIEQRNIKNDIFYIIVLPTSDGYVYHPTLPNQLLISANRGNCTAIVYQSHQARSASSNDMKKMERQVESYKKLVRLLTLRLFITQNQVDKWAKEEIDNNGFVIAIKASPSVAVRSTNTDILKWGPGWWMHDTLILGLLFQQKYIILAGYK